MASNHSNWPNPAEAPSLEDLAKCVHCGLCVNSCPTYAVTGLEVESPRGRIYLARAIDDGRLELTAAVQGHWDLCLQCRACEAVCPSGVPFGRIMEHARAQLDSAAPTGATGRRARKAVLRRVIANPRTLALAVAPVRWLANSPLRGIARWTGLLRLIPALARGEAQLAPRIGRPFRAGHSLPAVPGPVEAAVLFTGCVMGELFGDVHRATARVLARQGVATVASRGQGCCGALHAHAGDLAFARELARRNIDALVATAPAPIIVNSAGCGAAMKEYGDILASDPAYASSAREFASRVRDFTEYAAALAKQPPAIFPARVTYQDPCHLVHAQRIREQPRSLLREIDGCDLVETPGADLCCGAAGLYSLVQPAMSAELRTRKAAQFRDAAPDVIVTANPGCQLQYEAAVREAGISARVMHIAELLDEAQAAAAG